LLDISIEHDFVAPLII